MPRVVDHTDRRDQLAAAVLRVVGRDGLEAASVRVVALEAGVSMGGLRHYFADQRGLLVFAAHSMTGAVTRRMEQHFTAGPPGPELGARLLEELLPLDLPRRGEALVRLGCLARAPHDAALDEVRAVFFRSHRYVCRVVVTACRGLDLDLPPGEPLADPDDEAEAEDLHLFLDGLALQAVTSPAEVPPATARELVRRRLEPIIPR